MQTTVVMVLALSGLGCQNKGCEVFATPPVVNRGYDSNVPAWSGVPSGHPTFSGSTCGVGDSSDYPGGRLRSTLWSFVLGRDPEVPSARELECSFYSGRDGYQMATRPRE
jgi:hypothetical protein